MDRLWQEWELKADKYSDGLTGRPTGDLLGQDERMQLADMAFRASASLPAPKMPRSYYVMTAAESKKAKDWIRTKINKLRS
jgi:hypothetical protein